MPTSTRGSKKRPSEKRKPASGGRGSSARRGSARSTSITNYASALRWLSQHTDHERLRLVKYNSTSFSLERVRRLLRALDNPQKDLAFVHIAGTKGKGSSVAMLASMLKHCGYGVGTFTSPHLIDLRERIQVNGRMISHADLVDLFKLIRTKANQIGGEPPTFFEILTVCAIRYFADQAVDLAILETGLGGRLDSTNVVKPLVCGITQISLDHTHILGPTVGEIAAEKAGIIKKGVPVISCEQQPEVLKVLKAAAVEKEAPLYVVGRDIEFSYRFEASRELGPHTRVCLSGGTSCFEHLAVPLKGEHQAFNCGLSLGIITRLTEMGFKVPEDKLIEGLRETELPGRMEMAWPEPRILLDGAHNSASIKSLIRSVGAHVPYDSLVMIFGCGEDKDTTGMLEQVALGADKVIFTRARANPRAMEPADLLSKFGEVSGKMAQTAGNLTEALDLAARAVGREDLICITGSFYLVGEAKKHLAELAAKRAKQS